MTPAELSQERTMLIGKCDGLVDVYHMGAHDLHSLLEMRRELAVWGYRLSAHTKQVHGEAGLSYLQRKYTIARAITDARNLDATQKPPAMNVLEVQAQQLPSVVQAQQDETWREAEKDALKNKLLFIQQVLSSMSQELSVLSQEARNTHYQNQGA